MNLSVRLFLLIVLVVLSPTLLAHPGTQVSGGATALIHDLAHLAPASIMLLAALGLTWAVTRWLDRQQER